MADRQTHISCCEMYGKPFSAWDLRLYLDTHPNDVQAIECFARMHPEHCTCYACRGIDLDACSDGYWHHLDGPWPWEPDANCPIDRGDCRRGG